MIEVEPIIGDENIFVVKYKSGPFGPTVQHETYVATIQLYEYEYPRMFLFGPCSLNIHDLHGIIKFMDKASYVKPTASPTQSI